MASITKLVIGDKGVSLLVIVGLFIVLSLTLAPLSVYKPSDRLLKEYLESAPWNIAVLPPDFHGIGPGGSGGFILTPPKASTNPFYDLSQNAEEMILHIEQLAGKNVSLYCSGFIVPVELHGGEGNYTINLVVYRSPLVNDTLVYSLNRGLILKLENTLEGEKLHVHPLKLGSNTSGCLRDLYKEYAYTLNYNELVRVIELSKQQISHTETVMHEESYYSGTVEKGLQEMSGDAALFVPVSLLDKVVRQLEQRDASFYMSWEGGVPRYVILVKYDFSKIRFNPASPRSIEDTVKGIAASLHGYLPRNIVLLIYKYSDVLEAFRISTVVVFLVFVMGLFVVIPATAGAMTGGLKRILYLLRLRGVRYRVLKRSLLKATFIAVTVGLVAGLAGVAMVVALWMPEFRDMAFHDIFEDYFTVGAIIVSGTVAGILYWRRFVKHVGIEKLGWEWGGEAKTRSRVAWILLVLSLYHIARGYIGWSAIATLSSAPSNISMLVMIILILLSIIEFLTTIFTPVMLAYSISVIIMNNIDYLVRIVSSSKRILGDIAVVASGIGKLVTPSLVGLSTILVFSLAVLYPSLSTGFMASNAAENAAHVDIGAPYVFLGYYNGHVSNHTLRDLATNITSQCRGECGVLFHVRGGNGGPVTLTTAEDTDVFVGNDIVIIADPDSYYRSTYHPGETRVIGGSYSDAVKSLEKPGNAVLVSSWDSYTWGKARKAYNEKGYIAKGKAYVRIQVISPNGVPAYVIGSEKEYTVSYMVQVVPGKGLGSMGTPLLLVGPWMIELVDEGISKYASILNSTTTPVQVEVAVMSREPFNITVTGLTGSYIVTDNVTSSEGYALWEKSVKLGLGTPSLEFTGIMLVSLLIILTALLSYVSVKDVDRVYRLLRLRGINRRMTFMTLFTPWASITLVVGLIGILSGLGIDLIYKMTMLYPNSGFASLAGFQYNGGQYVITLVDGYVDKASVLAALPYTLILIVAVLVIPFVYFYKVTRGTPAQSMREV